MNGIEINDLSIAFKSFKIDRLSLNVKRGCITGLVGRNGAGKSTMIRCIMRQQSGFAGDILYDGKRFEDDEEGVLDSIACVYDTPHFDMTMKPKKVINIYKRAFSNFDEQKCADLMQKFNLPYNIRINKYSYGMQRKFCLILALCRNPEILILDEPTSGVDPFDRGEITSLVQEYMMDENHTVLFSTHITEDLDKIADYIVMIDNGKIILDDEKDVLLQSFRLVQCASLTPDMQAAAIGVQKNMFGYSFLTRDLTIEAGEGVNVKVPTIEEMFVHMTSSVNLF